MEHNLFHKLYEESDQFTLKSEIQALVNPSTLSLKTLKFIGNLIEVRKPNYILELGSGISTLFLASNLKDHLSARVFSVDHSDHYLRKTQELSKNSTNVQFIYAPISPYQFKLKRFAAYQNDFVKKIPNGIKFDLVIIDGPPSFKFGREAALYQIANFLKPETLILLDDSNREPEQEALSNWRKVWNSGVDVFEFPENKKGLAIIEVKDPKKMVSFPFKINEIWKSWIKTKRAIAEEKKDRMKNES